MVCRQCKLEEYLYFIWNDSEEDMELLKKINNQLIRLLEEDEETFLNLKLKDPVTNDVTLFVTDFMKMRMKKKIPLIFGKHKNALMKRIGS